MIYCQLAISYDILHGPWYTFLVNRSSSVTVCGTVKVGFLNIMHISTLWDSKRHTRITQIIAWSFLGRNKSSLCKAQALVFFPWFLGPWKTWERPGSVSNMDWMMRPGGVIGPVDLFHGARMAKWTKHICFDIFFCWAILGVIHISW